MADLYKHYGDKYSELIGSTLNDIDKEIQRISINIENGIVSDAQKMQYLLDNRQELVNYTNGKFATTYARSINGAYADSIGQTKQLFDENGIKINLSESTLATYNQMRINNTILYNIEAEKNSALIFDSMFRWAFTGNAGSLDRFTAKLDELSLSKYGSTIVNTQVSAFYRSATVTAAVDNGITRFRYGGPKPDREFCKHVLGGDRSSLGISSVEPQGEGRVYTLQEIQAMDNGQTDNVFATAGGFNCVHFWIPVAEK